MLALDRAADAVPLKTRNSLHRRQKKYCRQE
jgi:hypothetical protein